MNVLITGGAGFIGSWVAQFVRDAGHNVLVVDDLSTGKIDNIPEGVKFKEIDIRDSSLDTVFEEFKPRSVFHLAAQASVSKSVKHVSEDLDINLKGGINLLECSRKHNIKQFIFSSTGGAIYGNVKSGRASETWPPCPESPYAAAKASFELYLSVYTKLWGINSTILRYSNIFGPRQDYNGEAGVIAIFCNKLNKGEQPAIFAKSSIGDSGCFRDYLYVEDVAKVNLKVLESGKTGVFNVGSGNAVSTQKIFDTLKEIANVDIEPIYQNHRVGDVKRNVLDISKARRELAFEPEIRLNENLRKTWDYFQKG
ncbi:NAD-dependent epimerase/dehydratase family protein [Candidatus Latescibacterota bacterium]